MIVSSKFNHVWPNMVSGLLAANKDDIKSATDITGWIFVKLLLVLSTPAAAWKLLSVCKELTEVSPLHNLRVSKVELAIPLFI